MAYRVGIPGALIGRIVDNPSEQNVSEKYKKRKKRKRGTSIGSKRREEGLRERDRGGMVGQIG